MNYTEPPDGWAGADVPAIAEALGVPQRPSRLDAALTRAHSYLCRFVAFPDSHAGVAAVLWAAHTHRVRDFDSTPRLAFLSPEPGSGKTRALEVLGVLCPNPMHAVNATPAALFRAVSDLEARPTILFDEIDTVFGPKAKDNEEVRGFLNAGHRRSGVAYRCVAIGTQQKVVAFPAYCCVAVAGLNDVPDTISSRAIIVRMRRRKPGEPVEPFRPRINEPEGFAIAKRLAGALDGIDLALDPELPEGVTDRPADVWEPLLAIAQAAGGRWPGLAADACRRFVFDKGSEQQSLSVLLLSDLRIVFDGRDALHTEDVIAGLRALEEAPWSDLRGKPIDPRRLARLLSRYGVRSCDVKLDAQNRKGYRREDLHDPWERYLSPVPGTSATSATSATPGGGTGQQVAFGTPEVALADPEVALADDLFHAQGRAGSAGSASAAGGTCVACGEPMTSDFFGDGRHATCTEEVPG